MSFAFPLPDGASYVPDECFAEAYRQVSDTKRACLKTAIARNAAVLAPELSALPLSSESSILMRQGFRFSESFRPADWFLLLLDEESVSPARLLAALLPAMLAGVPDILVCRVADRRSPPFPLPLLLALELAGQEAVLEIEAESCQPFVRDCCRAGYSGRLLMLGKYERFAQLVFVASEEGLSWRLLGKQLRIGLSTPSSGGNSASREKLLFAHPDALLFDFPCEGQRLDALLLAEDEASSLPDAPSLLLTPGHEACWLFPDLGLTFFREKTFAFIGGIDAEKEE